MQSFTYFELAQLIRKTATAFSEQFILPGDYVLYLGSNCLEYLSLYFGAICVGAVPVSIPKTNVSLRKKKFNIKINDYSYAYMYLLPILYSIFIYLLEDIKTKIIQHNIQYLVISSEIDLIWIKKLLNSVSTISVMDIILFYRCV